MKWMKSGQSYRSYWSRAGFVLSLAACLSLVSQPVAWAAVSTVLPTRSAVLKGAAITQLGEVKMGGTANFGDCLDYSLDIKGGKCKFLGVVPIPALVISLEYKEPTALVETTCLRGRSGLKGSENVLSKVLNSSLRQDSEQKCVSPIKTKGGDYHKYFYDVHVWGMSDSSRLLTSGSPHQVAQSLMCKFISNITKIINFINLLVSVGVLDFSNLGKNLSEMAKNVVNNLKNMVKNIAELPQKVIDQVKGTLDQLEKTITGLPQAAKDVVKNVESSVKNIGTQFQNIVDKISEFNPSEIMDKIQKAGNEFFDNIKNGFSALQKGLENIGDTFKDLQKVLESGEWPIDLKGLEELNKYTEELTQPLKALEGLEKLKTFQDIYTFTKTFDPLQLDALKKGLEIMKGTLQEGMMSLDDLPQSVQVASINGEGTAPTKHISRLVESLDEVIKILEEFESAEYVSSFNNMSNALDTLAAQLGLDGSVQETVKLNMKNGHLFADGFLKNGGSELAIAQGEDIFDGIIDSLMSAGETALQLANDLGTGGETDACGSAELLGETFAYMEQFKDLVEDSKFELGLFQEATYLPRGYVQYVQKELPGPSCPLTSGGYKANATLKGITKERYMCRQVCREVEQNNGTGSGSGDTKTVCQDEPVPGYYLPEGVSCLENRMSTVVVEGLYPACNGYRPEVRSEYNSRTQEYEKYNTGNYYYDEALDHRKILDRRRQAQLTEQVKKTYNNVKNAKKYVHQYIKALTISCSEENTMGDFDKNIASSNKDPFEMSKLVDVTSMRPDHRQRALNSLGMTAKMEGLSQVQAAMARLDEAQIRMAQGMGSMMDGGSPISYKEFMNSVSNPFTGNMSTLRSLKKMFSLLNKGALRQYVAASISQYSPYGLWSAFLSEATDWERPRSELTSFIKKTIGFIVSSTPLWAVCSGGSILGSLTSSQLSIVSQLNYVLGCIGSWGMDVRHGWAYNKDKAEAAALIGVKGLRISHEIGGVQPDISGKGDMFNHDFPELYGSNSPYAVAAGYGAPGKGRTHKGSGCYEVGTSDTSWHSVGERGAPASVLETVNPFKYLPDPSNVVNIDPSLQSEMDAGYYVQTHWKHTKCEIKISPLDLFKVLAGQLPSPCSFQILY